MFRNRIDKKWYALIWFALIFACFIQNAYAIYYGVAELESTAANKITLLIIEDICFDGLIPALICYICASLMYSMAWARGMRFSSRNDFLYIVMIFTAGAKAVIGLINIFSVLAPVVNVYVSMVITMIVYAVSYYAMYFAVLKPKYMHIKVCARTFSFFGSIYMTVLGVFTLLPAVGVFILHSGAFLPEQYFELFENTAVRMLMTKEMFGASVASVVVYALLVIATIIAGALLNKQAKKAPETEDTRIPFGVYPGAGGGGSFSGDRRADGAEGSPFEETSRPGEVSNGTDDDNVFDEFDI